jgi:hypothetical protein
MENGGCISSLTYDRLPAGCYRTGLQGIELSKRKARVKVGSAHFMLTFSLSVVLASIALYSSALHAYKEKQTGLDWAKVFTMARWDCG